MASCPVREAELPIQKRPRDPQMVRATYRFDQSASPACLDRCCSSYSLLDECAHVYASSFHRPNTLASSPPSLSEECTKVFLFNASSGPRISFSLSNAMTVRQ